MRICLAAVLAASLATLLWVYLFTGVLNVRSVEVRGTRKLEADYLRSLSGITPETHLLRMDADSVKEALLTEPYLKGVRVHRRFPATVILEVTEREPVCFFRQNGRCHLLDGEGVVLESPGEPAGGLVELEGIDMPLLYPGVKVEDAAFAEMVSLIGELPEDLQRDASKAGCKAGEGYYLEVAGTRIILGDSRDIPRKGEIALLALKEMAHRYGRLEYIDVTYPDNPVIKPAS